MLQQNKQTTIFSAKNKYSISEPNFTKSEGKVRFGQIFFWKWSSRRAKKDAAKQKVLCFQEVGQNENGGQNWLYPSLSLSRPQNVSLQKGF